MAVRPTDPEALHLFQLIGAPMLAVVQAEAQAAQVSAEFIKRVGFETQEGVATAPVASNTPATGAPAASVQQAATAQAGMPSTPPATAQPLQDGGDLGNLRIAEFQLDRYAQDGTPRPHVVRVPVLSLFPIPLLQVKHAEFDFDIRVISRVPMGHMREEQQDAPPLSKDFLEKNRVELKGFLASSRDGGEGKTTTNASIKVRVRLEQSDLPAGLLNLMTIMGETASVMPSPPVAPKK